MGYLPKAHTPSWVLQFCMENLQRALCDGCSVSLCWVKKSYPACWWDRDLKGLLKDSLGWALEDFDRDLRRLGDISAQHFLRQISYRQAWRGKGWCGCECGSLVSLVCEGLRSTFSHVQRLQWRVSGGIDSVPNWKQQLCFLLSHSTIISESND